MATQTPFSHHREACLKSRYARVYANVPAGQWLPADELAEQLVARARDFRSRGVPHRTFDPKHFEFRVRSA
jgi:hypothetical protein